MKVSVHEKEGLFKSLRVDVEGEVVRKALDEVYEYLKASAQIEGFRKGAVPLWIIKARYKNYIQEEVGKKVADATLQSAIRMAEVKPAADIYLESVELEEQTPRLSYTVSFEVVPEFELRQVEGLEVEAPKVEFSEELVQKALNEIGERHAVWEPVERPAQRGDLVVVDYEIEETQTGEKTEGETSGVVGERMFREEIDRELEGKKEGDELSFTELTIYDTEGKEAGKANVRVRIKAVKAKVLPELTDDFVKEAGLGDNVDSALEKLRRDIQESLQRMREEAIESAVAQKLVQLHELEVPRTLLAREVEFLVRQRLSYLSQYGIDTRHVNLKALAEESTPQAIFTIKLRYILDKYAQEKDIQVSEEDVQRKLEELAQEHGMTPEALRDYFEKQNLMPVLTADIRREKAIKDIMQKAVIKEVEKEERKDEGNT